MSTNIKINVVEPGSSTPTPVDPSADTTTYTTTTTDISVPDTGLFTHGIGAGEATIITISSIALLLTIAATIVTFLYRNNKKQGKITKLVRIVDHTKIVLKSKKRITASLTALALLASAGTLAALLANTGKSNTSAVENNIKSNLTVTESSEELTIEVADEPVFAVLPVELTVAEETQAGYTLTAYTNNTDIVSTTNPDYVIPMVTVDEEELAALTDNTYGFSLSEPKDKDSEVYTTLSTDADTPTIITDKDYEATEENDTTTVYYGFYITPDTPYGIYEGSDIFYEATANEVATVVFDGNGLTFNGAETNIVKYEIVTTTDTEKYSHTPNITDEGAQEGNVGYKGEDVVDEVITIPGAVSVHIELTYGGGYDYNRYMGYASMWQGSHPTYTAQNDYSNDDSIKNCGGGDVTDGRYAGGNTNTTVECDIAGDSVTFAYYADGGGPGSGPTYGYYAVVTGYDADGDIVYLPGNKMVSGGYLIPSSEAYSKFMGWSEEEEATTPTYTTEESIEKELDLTLGETTTLYAVWQAAYTISYNGNGADTTTNMDNVEQYTTGLTSTAKQVDLLAPNFTKEGYGFVGWSTDQNAWDDLTDDNETNNPTIYGPNQMITVDPTASTKLVLYAVWAPAETDNSGNPVSLQDWHGCSNLTATTYDSTTNTLSVGKNTITALTDSRDGNIYTVARLADGNCWMTENLRLSSDATISTTNTNNPLTIDGNVAIKNNDGNTSAHLSPTTNSWCTNSDSDCYDQSYLNTNNTALTTVSPVFNQDFTSGSHANFNDKIGSYGNYYNWYSATAGNGKGETTSTVVGDICPAGWQLPVGGSNNTSGSFYYLNQQMGGNESSQGSNNWRSFPNNFVYSGTLRGSSVHDRGRYGVYLSSTAAGADGGCSLSFKNDYVYPGASADYKSIGRSVRCVAPVQ